MSGIITQNSQSSYIFFLKILGKLKNSYFFTEFLDIIHHSKWIPCTSSNPWPKKTPIFLNFIEFR